MHGYFARLVLLPLLLFFMAAPVSFAATLDDMDGVWLLDVEATLRNTVDEELKEVLRGEAGVPFMQMTLSLDAKGHTITLAMPGEQSEIIGFAVEKEEGGALVLTTEDSSKLRLELKDAGVLAVGEIFDDKDGVKDVLYFKR